MSTYPPTASASYAAPQASKGFFSTLFDFSFNSFLAPKLIRLLYGAFVVLAGVLTIALLTVAFSVSKPLGILALPVSPIVFVFFVMIFRVALELNQVLFAIESHTGDQLAMLRSGLSPVRPGANPRA